MKLRADPVTVGFIAAGVGAVLFIRYWPFVVEGIRAAKSGVHNLVSPDGSSPLANPVSRFVASVYSAVLPSSAEREVDAMLKPPTRKPYVAPAATPPGDSPELGSGYEYLQGGSFENARNYELKKEIRIW